MIGDEKLGRLPVRIVVPITGWNPRYANYPWMTELQPGQGSGLTKQSSADALQIRTVALTRFRQHPGVIQPPILDEIASSIALCVRAPKR